MAYLYVRRSGRVEIREARHTPRGPRSRTLASFRGALTEAQLDQAEASAARRFDRDALRARARELGIPLEGSSVSGAARALLAGLRAGARLTPPLVTLLREALADREAAPVPEALADVRDWIGASERERGRALRDVLRLYDTIARSRGPLRETAASRFPRFEVRGEGSAA